MNTFSKKVLKLVAIIEAALLFISLIIFQNFGMFMYFLLLAALFLGGIEHCFYGLWSGFPKSE